MDSSKQSNKISDIVRLKRMLKKWRKQAHDANSTNDGNNISSSNSSNKNSNNSSSASSNKNSNNSSSTSSNKNSSSTSSSNTKKGSLSRSNSMKGGINFLKRTLSFTDLSANTAVSSNGAVRKGFLAVQVGEEMKRFVIPTNYLGHQAFSVLLKEAEEEFGFQQEGVLRIPCEVQVFENILKMVEEKSNSHAKQGLKFSRNDGIVCGSSETPSLPQAHHPPSPMCR